MRKIFLLVFLIPAFLCLNAQKDSSALFKLNKKSYKYVGIQANLLLQQFLSFNSNSGINTNPYIFTYSKSNMLTGNGFGFGTGFNVSDNSSNDGVSSIRVQNANFSFRFGYEKKYLQKERLIPFWGIDIGFGGTYNKTVSQLDQSFNINTITTETCFCIGTTTAEALKGITENIVIANKQTMENVIIQCINYYKESI